MGLPGVCLSLSIYLSVCMLACVISQTREFIRITARRVTLQMHTRHLSCI